jgi:hypothetical protein
MGKPTIKNHEGIRKDASMKTMKFLLLITLFVFVVMACAAGQSPAQEQPDINGIQTAPVEV